VSKRSSMGGHFQQKAYEQFLVTTRQIARTVPSVRKVFSNFTMLLRFMNTTELTKGGSTLSFYFIDVWRTPNTAVMPPIRLPPSSLSGFNRYPCRCVCIYTINNTSNGKSFKYYLSQRMNLGNDNSVLPQCHSQP
jgi:hypothetical protein